MDWIIGILLLLSGAVIGFFISLFLSKRQANTTSGPHLEKEIKSILSEQGQIHINECRQVLEAMEKQSELLKQQLDHYEDLLTTPEDEEDSPQLSYFGDQASVYLRNKGKTRQQKNQTADYQPRDYPSASSGLFSGKPSGASERKSTVDEQKVTK
ncbi:ZapG family protein [Lacimicrobium alkaliphilum]|uniref:DUF1043 domain-containing protein n=1 Tax=Lacimicrobium alkaliphilum TaxID=1526571 RepID=A0ABQ1QYG1_9ALTE|nr:DUF1043 family protein [Lacimicrobium alkaliphilum]GGD50138.1 hypothetical protein GCM10011357_02570 [Lacimicrobium alkaliphilum]